MRKNLSAIGNSLGLVIEKPILELLGITRDTELEVTTDGTRLIVEPVREAEAKGRRGRVGAATKRVMKNHDRTLRRLAE
jgi:antitoxin MazE